MLLQVALPVPLYRVFDYRYPFLGELPAVGVRVKVPFVSKQLIGIVVNHIDEHASEVAPNKLKAIVEVLDDEPVFDAYLLKLANWLCAYYHYPLGDTMAVMLPTLVKAGESICHERYVYHISPHADDDFIKQNISKTAKKQLADLDIIRLYPDSSEEGLVALGVTRKNVAVFFEKGLIVRRVDTNLPKETLIKQSPLALNDEQRHALNAINDAIDARRYQGILLHGVTGSGKTEVYLQAMAKVLGEGRQVLILVPEIGLTPQTRERFLARFDVEMVELHSSLNDKERLAGWQACRQGWAKIIIATRSALLYPFDDLGLIIIDEAHDLSFKQQDHLRYHACDVALYVGVLKQIPVVMGTATPSLEQLKLVLDGKLTECLLTKRAGEALPPTFRLVDMRLGAVQHMDMAGEYKNTELSHETVEAIRQTLARGEQVLVFLNRRGYAPIMLCGACGWQADCVRCSSHLTLHKSTLKHTHHAYLKCHHCGYQIAMPMHCPTCRSTNLAVFGQGTGQLFERLHGLFANPQTSTKTYPVVQIDRDTITKKGAWNRLYQQISGGEPMILVGTQMLAKGHHFAGVTLVVVADADAGFLSPNFRSPEHTAQIIMQVAGRAGRSEKRGQVLIQTFNPQNPLLLDLIKHGYDRFAKNLLNERQLMGLPPYAHAVLIQAEAYKLDVAKNAIIALKNHLPTSHPFAVLAPIDAPMVKQNNRFRVQMLILSKERSALHHMLSWWWDKALGLSGVQGVKMVLDIDPVGW